LCGRDAIRAYFAQMPGRRAAFVMEGVDAVIRETDDRSLLR
jgi:hypothetical protein